jgi:hypothetical protein
MPFLQGMDDLPDKMLDHFARLSLGEMESIPQLLRKVTALELRFPASPHGKRIFSLFFSPSATGFLG